MYGDYLGLNSDYTYQEYQTPSLVPSITNVEGATTVVTTINGAAGSNINFVSSIGLTFTGGVGGNVTVGGVVIVAGGGTGATTPAGARTNLEAAKSGINTDISQLNGASQVDVSVNYLVGGTQVVGAQQVAIPDAAGGATVDAEARAAINALLAAARLHGLIDT